MIKCIIVEDELPSAERLLLLLGKEYAEDICVEKWLKTPEETLTYLSQEKPDLVFFDVEIQDQTAFELLRQIPNPDFKIIFTTAHQEYALQAIKVAALDYLLKPIDAEELKQAIQKVIKSQSSDAAAILQLIKNISLEKLPLKIGLPSVFGTEYVRIDQIIRCQADVNYTLFHLKDGRKITVSKTLKSFEDQLRPHGFFRIHNSHLVDLKQIRFYNKGKGGYVTLDDGCELEVASRRKEELIFALKKT